MAEYARLSYPNGEVRLCPMSGVDAAGIAAMYRDVQITALNCRERLLEHSVRSFQNIGGMFCIQNEEALSRMSDGKHGFATVAKDQDGNILAFIWNGFPSPRNTDAEKISYINGLEHWDDAIRELNENGILARGGEIIVASSCLARLWLPMFYIQLGLLLKKGIPVMLGEVFRVVGYHHNGKNIKTDLLNERSKAILTRTGAIHLGEAPERVIALDGFRVTVRPEVMLWEIRGARETILQKMRRESFAYHEANG